MRITASSLGFHDQLVLRLIHQSVRIVMDANMTAKAQNPWLGKVLHNIPEARPSKSDV